MWHAQGSLIGGLVIGMLLSGCGAASIEGAVPGESPADVFRALQRDVERGDWEQVYRRCHPKLQGQLDIFVQVGRAVRDGSDHTEQESLEPAERYAQWVRQSDKRYVGEFAGEVVSQSVDGEQAVVFVEQYGEQVEVRFTKDHGQWRYAGTSNPGAAQRQAKEAQRNEIRTLLVIVRGQIGRYRKQEGRTPDLAGSGWSVLEGRLARPPENPLSPDDVATKIVQVSRAGATGADVDPAKAGWVWNTAAEQIYAAGFDEEQQHRPTAETTLRPQERRRLAHRQLHRARNALIEYGLRQRQFVDRSDPDLIGHQWSRLVETGCLRHPPSNPYSPADVASRIVELTTPGATGSVLDPNVAGWAWNSADGKLYLVGLEE